MPGGNGDMSSATIDRTRFRPGLPWMLLAGGLVLGTVLGLGGCGGGSDTRETADSGDVGGVDYGSSGNFPVPPEIRPNVDFWRHVYGVWSRGQVAFHDDEHMGVIYEVARLPGPLGGGLQRLPEAVRRQPQGLLPKPGCRPGAEGPLQPDPEPRRQGAAREIREGRRHIRCVRGLRAGARPARPARALPPRRGDQRPLRPDVPRGHAGQRGPRRSGLPAPCGVVVPDQCPLQRGRCGRLAVHAQHRAALYERERHGGRAARPHPVRQRRRPLSVPGP